jgi:hypothetical protein
MSTPRSDIQSTPRSAVGTPRYGDNLYARPADEDYDESDYYHSEDGRFEDLDESIGERTRDITNYYERLPKELK